MTESSTSLCLLNGPYTLVNGHQHAVPEGSKRLVVLVAIRRWVTRRAAAELLWPDVEPLRAAGNLRSAVWRLRCAELPLLIERDGALRLSPDVQVDIDVLCAGAAQVASGRPSADDRRLLAAAVEALDLLPGWYEEWVCAERERLRTTMLTAIDAIAVQLRRAGRCAEAIDAALVAVTADPLRDSSQAALITAHLREGNLCEARRAYAAYRRVLRAEFGLEPPERLARLVATRTRPVPQTRPTGRRAAMAMA
jgi:DNA-binding SARP family transcriptional activator